MGNRMGILFVCVLLLSTMASTVVWAQDETAATAAPEAAPADTAAPADANQPPADQAAEESAAAAPPPAAPAVAPDRRSASDDNYEIKLKNLEEKVNELKEKIFRSKTRLMLLREQITKGVIAGSKVIINHQNLLTSGFKLESVAYYLDGAPIYGKIDIDGDLNQENVIEIHNGTIAPGSHLVNIYMVYRGDSSVFRYVEGVQVKLRSSYSFRSEEGKLTTMNIKGVDNGGVLTPFEERPAVEIDTEITDLSAEDLEQEGQAEGEGFNF